MPKPHLSRNMAIAALLLGLIFLAGNLTLGANYPGVANALFVLAILCIIGFVVSALLWSFGWVWHAESPPPGAPTKPGGPPAQKPPTLQLKPPAKPPGTP